MLNFEDEVTGIDGVEATARDEEEIAFFSGVAVKAIFEGVILEMGVKGIAADGGFKADHEMSIGFCVEDEPAFGFGFTA